MLPDYTASHTRILAYIRVCNSSCTSSKVCSNFPISIYFPSVFYTLPVCTLPSHHSPSLFVSLSHSLHLKLPILLHLYALTSVRHFVTSCSTAVCYVRRSIVGHFRCFTVLYFGSDFNVCSACVYKSQTEL